MQISVCCSGQRSQGYTAQWIEHLTADQQVPGSITGGGLAHPNSHAQAYPMEAQTVSSPESNHSHNQKPSSDTESDQLDWDPERIDDDGYPLMDENGSTLVPIPRDGPLNDDEVSSLKAWAQGYREVRKTCTIQSRDVVTIKPSQAVPRKLCVKLCS